MDTYSNQIDEAFALLSFYYASEDSLTDEVV